MPRLQACRRPTVCLLGFALLLAAQPLRAFAQDPLAIPIPQPDSARTIDPQLDEFGQPIADANNNNRTPRYAEPPPPPFDFWQPTWMPCQSLRTNRSVVLGHLYWGADILGWATKGVHVPALITSGTQGNGDGIIGQGDTVVRFGNEFQHNEMRPGGRLTIGWWFNPNQYSGIEWHYFELDGADIRFHAAVADGSSILARPFFDAGTGLENTDPIASDSRLNSSINAFSDFQLTSTGIIFRDLLWASPYARVDYLAGYRHTHLYDRIRTRESFVAEGDSVFDDDARVTRIDQFRAVNQFDGADFGFKGWWSNNGKLAVTTVSRIAIGATNNNVIINGSTTVRDGNTTTTTPGGILTQPSNIGSRARQEFGTVTELGIGLSWQPGCFWKFNLGYTWFYWSQVARAASQIDRTVDPNQFAPNNGTGDRPAFHLRTTSFWADGINGGFTYQF